MEKFIIEIRVKNGEEQYLYGVRGCEYSSTLDILKKVQETMNELNRLQFANVQGFLEDFISLASGDSSYVPNPYAAIDATRGVLARRSGKVVPLCLDYGNGNTFTAYLENIWEDWHECPVLDGITVEGCGDYDQWFKENRDRVLEAVNICPLVAVDEDDIVQIIGTVRKNKLCWAYNYENIIPDTVIYYVPIIPSVEPGVDPAKTHGSCN